MGVVGGVAENRGQWRHFGVIWSIGASCGGHWAGSDLGQGEGRWSVDVDGWAESKGDARSHTFVFDGFGAVSLAL